MEPDTEFDDHDVDVDDDDAVIAYNKELIAAAEAFGVPIPDDYPVDAVRDA